MTRLSIRPALPDDAAALAALHHAVWHETYAHLAPEAARRRLDLPHRRASWEAALADPARAAWLAMAEGQALGLIATGPPAAPDLAALPGNVGEIRHLYTAAAARRQGVASRLLATALDRLAALGCTTAALGVVRENQAARRFYAAQGGVETGRFTDPGPLWRSDMIAVAWTLSAPR